MRRDPGIIWILPQLNIENTMMSLCTFNGFLEKKG